MVQYLDAQVQFCFGMPTSLRSLQAASLEVVGVTCRQYLDPVVPAHHPDQMVKLENGVLSDLTALISAHSVKVFMNARELGTVNEVLAVLLWPFDRGPSDKVIGLKTTVPVASSVRLRSTVEVSPRSPPLLYRLNSSVPPCPLS